VILLDRLSLVLLGIVVYVWLLYPAFVFALAFLVTRWSLLFKHPTQRNGREAASPLLVSVIIPVHNEQRTISAKLQNCLELFYPHDGLEIIVASDSSTDQTREIVSAFSVRDSRIIWLESNRRVGKSGIQNLAVTHARGDVFLFTDAGTDVTPGALQAMIGALDDPGVGLVTATVFFGHPEDAIQKGQGFYWRYELFLREAESRAGVLATGSGQALLLRRELFRPLPDCYGDDCIMPLDVRLQGYRVIQDRQAIVYDTMPHSIEGELRARIRMTARNWTGTLSRPALLNPQRFPLTSLGIISHKLLRWLTPFVLAALFFLSALLAMKGETSALVWIQGAFYLCALIGWRLAHRRRPAWLFGYPFSFCLANIGFLLGIVKALRNQKVIAY